MENGERSPGAKLALVLAVVALLSLPLFSVWFLVYDRQAESIAASTSITQGWGNAQTMTGPLLAIPYRATVSETVTENNRPVTRTRTVWRELTLAPQLVDIATAITPERRKRSIYEVVLYETRANGTARFALPPEFARLGIEPVDIAFERAELRFGVSDTRGLAGQRPRVLLGGRSLPLQPSGGDTRPPGFFALIDAGAITSAPLAVNYAFELRGHESLSILPRAGDTVWRVSSPWPHPSFQGGFLPYQRRIGADGFTATYRIGNLALGRSLIDKGDVGSSDGDVARPEEIGSDPQAATIAFVQPVDVYSQIDRSAKYGFLIIGFTFLAFLLFDIVGGVRVSTVEYLLVGAALVLFFVMTLAFAELLGFTGAFALAALAIVGLNTAYSAAVLKSWRRAALIGLLLSSLYAVLFVLLSLEDLALLAGSLMLFVGLAAVMFVTRKLDWGGRDKGAAATAG